MRTFSLFTLTVFFASPVFAASIAAKSLNCGGYVSLEKENTKTLLKVMTTSENCKEVSIEGMKINKSILKGSNEIELNQSEIGNVLPILIGDKNGNSEVVILEIKSANSAQNEALNKIAEAQAKQAEIEAKKRREKEQADKAAAAAVGTAVVVGAGAVVVDEVVSGEH